MRRRTTRSGTRRSRCDSVTDSVSQDLRGWVNTGLMTLFFLVVGLEARREFDIGDLRERKRVTLPLLAGIAGMVVPVGIYLAFNGGRNSAHGWGAVMSTDTAFALGMLALVGPRFPDRLRAFMLTVVVVDDIVALLVIATRIHQTPALRCRCSLPSRCSRACSSFARFSCRIAIQLYVVFGAATWLALFKSGIDPVVVGLALRPPYLRLCSAPARPRPRDRGFPAIPRTTDRAARPPSQGASRSSNLTERAAAATLGAMDDLPHRAAVRPRECRHPDQRRLHLDGVHVTDHAWASSSATYSASRSASCSRRGW